MNVKNRVLQILLICFFINWVTSKTTAQETLQSTTDVTYRQALLKTKKTERFPIMTEIHNNHVLIEGDIVLGTTEEIFTNARGAITLFPGKRWPNATIPYQIEAGHPKLSDILTAINIVNTQTNLCVIPQSTETDYVKFFLGSGCSSFVGKRGGQQPINLTSGCRLGSIIHEICHAAGMYHEQSRSDRDDFVTINFQNIRDMREGNFRKYSVGDDVGAYDYGSLMHYPRMAFSKNGQPTIVVKTPPGTDQTIIGQRAALSAGDVATLNQMYPTPCNTNQTFCSGTTTLTQPSSTLNDGSGFGFYGNNSDCRWLIQPANASSIILKFDEFSTEAGADFVKVYDGNTTSANLLGSFSGQNLPNQVTSTGGSMLIHFESNSTLTDTGWQATYTSVLPSFECYDNLPNPQLNYQNKKELTIDEEIWTAYELSIHNWAAYPSALFEAYSDGNPCSGQQNPSRLQVNIFNHKDQLLNQICNVMSPFSLNNISFLVPEGDCPPDSVYVELYDQICNKQYVSFKLPMYDFAPPKCFGQVICYQNLDDPILGFDGKEDYTANGQNWTRYNIPVLNRADFPADLFKAAPHLPPCGLNNNASRTWVNIYDADDNRLYGFCALTNTETLADIWFARPQGDCPPRGVYIQFLDRECNIAYTSPILDLTEHAPAGCFDQTCPTNLPAPNLSFENKEDYTANGQDWTRYNLDVTNFNNFPTAMFAAAPNLAPCGSNTNAARTWVNIYDDRDNYIYGFCALGNNTSLNNIWFAVPRNECPPNGIYIQLNDRACEKVYTSNVISLSNVIPQNCTTDGCPDLIVTELTVDDFTANSIKYSFIVRNIGTAPANLDGPTSANFDNISIQTFLSADTIFNNSGDIASGGTILGVSPLGYLEPGESSFRGNFSASANVNPSTHPYLTIKVDWGERSTECNEDNNTFYQLIAPSSEGAACETSYIINDIAIANNHFIAQQFITSNGQINGNNSVTFQAGNYVELKSGFQVASGATFTATIDNCTSNASATTTLGNNVFTKNSKLFPTTAFDEQSLIVFPNPTSSQLNIHFTKPINANITLYNATGQKMITHQTIEQQTVIDLTNIPRGVYFMQVFDQATKKQTLRKVVKLE